jgi:hypothetical protein
MAEDTSLAETPPLKWQCRLDINILPACVQNAKCKKDD